MEEAVIDLKAHLTSGSLEGLGAPFEVAATRGERDGPDVEPGPAAGRAPSTAAERTGAPGHRDDSARAPARPARGTGGSAAHHTARRPVRPPSPRPSH